MEENKQYKPLPVTPLPEKRSNTFSIIFSIFLITAFIVVAYFYSHNNQEDQLPLGENVIYNPPLQFEELNNDSEQKLLILGLIKDREEVLAKKLEEIRLAKLRAMQESHVGGGGHPLSSTAVVIPSPPTPELIEGDLNGDGMVDLQDWTIIKAQYEELKSNLGVNCSEQDCGQSDLNGDGLVDIQDWSLFKQDYNSLISNYG